MTLFDRVFRQQRRWHASLGLSGLAAPVLLVLALGCDGSAGSNEFFASSPVAPKNARLNISANPPRIEQIGGSSTITIIATREDGLPVRESTEIQLTSTLGQIESTVRTDSDGVAIATLHAQDRAGKAVVSARSGSAAATVEVVIGEEVVGELQAAFSTVVQDLRVFFQDESTGSPTAWLWDFGDGSESTEREPTHVYARAGSYLVTLTVSNVGGESDSVGAGVIVPPSQAMPPVADFAVTISGLRVFLADQSTGNPTRWRWQFGDGGEATRRNPRHNYEQPGSYTIRLTVTNAAGSNSKNVTVTVEGADDDD